MQLVTDRLERWYTERLEWPRPWLEAAEESELLLRLRPDDLARLIEEMWAVVSAYVDSPRGVDDPDAENVVLHLYAMPSGTRSASRNVDRRRRAAPTVPRLAMRWFQTGLQLPVLVLLLRAHDLDLTTIGVPVTAVYGLTTALFGRAPQPVDWPTSSDADRC